MILSSLVDYYEILASTGEISKSGYCMANVSYALNLSKEGQLLNVIPLEIPVSRGKKMVEVPQVIEVPEQVKRAAGVSPNFLCDNSGYVLGIDKKGKPERSKQCFNAFKNLHHEVLDNVDTIQAKAVLSFIDNWRPDQVGNCTAMEDYLDKLNSGVNIVFNIAGYGFAHECPLIMNAWEGYKSMQANDTKMQCLVTGQVMPIARLHPSLKGVYGAQSMGVSIVSFNDRAYESYGRDKQQGLNAPVSEYAVFAYTTALNSLLNDKSHKQSYGDTTVVYWAKSPQKIYKDLFSFSLNPEQSTDDMQVDTATEGIIESVFLKLIEGKPVRDDVSFDESTMFSILGLAPNAARLSVRFYMQNTFGKIMNNIIKHYKDLEIERSSNDFEYLPLWKIMLETVSPKSKDKSSSPLLSGSVLRSIFQGTPYPRALYNSVMVRIRAERDISRGKVAIIKACLLRSNINEVIKEVLTVSLNEQSHNKAYVLGRLFAVLEKAQQDANPGINTTIKDRYFTSACATPSSVFPVLLRLSQHHISKATKYGYISEIRITELMEKLKVEDRPFPQHLTLDEQGIFILGYYHQSKANYAKKDKGDVKND